jgi:hypothetical protein
LLPVERLQRELELFAFRDIPGAAADTGYALLDIVPLGVAAAFQPYRRASLRDQPVNNRGGFVGDQVSYKRLDLGKVFLVDQ